MLRRMGKHACDKGDGMQRARQAKPNPAPAAQTPYVDHMPSQASAGSAVAPRCGPPAQLPRTPPLRAQTSTSGPAAHPQISPSLAPSR